MVKQVSSAVPGIGATSGIQDQFVRQALRPLVDAHNARNGSSQEGFVTRGELAREVSAVLSRAGIAPAVSSAEDPNGKPLPIKVNGYSKAQLKRDLATGVASILSAAGPDYQLWVDSVGAKIEIGHKGVVYAGYSALADTTNTRLPALAVTAGGIAMGYNDLDGNWVDSVSIEAATGIASFSGTVNALYGNFAEGITIGGTGITLGDLSAGSYNTAALEMDLESGVGGILAGVGGNYRMWVDTVGSQIQIGHKDIAYNAYSAVADTTNTRLPGLAITSAGVAMGFNDIDGTWHNSVSIDAATGTASFLGAVNATSGNFANGITIGGSSVTLGDLAAGGYTTADLEADLAAGVGSILAGSGSSYKMWVDTGGAKIEIGHKDLNLSGLGAGYTGTLRSGLVISSAGIGAGYNRKSDGAWVNALAIDASGSASFSGAIYASSGTFTGTVTASSFVSGNVRINDSSGDSLYTIALNASTAATQAASALSALADISSDNRLTSVEKLAIRKEWDSVIASEKASLNSQASAYGVTSENAAYNSAFVAYATYLNGGTPWSFGVPLWITDANIPATTSITGSVLRATAKTFYDARTALFAAISAKINTTATSALSTANTAVQPSAIVGMLTAASSYVLTGVVTPTDSGAIRCGAITWNSTTGALTGGSGVAITERGIMGAKSGVATFTIDTTGTATFAGDINTAGDAYFFGKTSKTASLMLDGATSYIDYSSWSDAVSNPSSSAYYRAGCVGNASVGTGSAKGAIGVLGKATAGGGVNSYGVVGEGGYVGGYFASSSNIAGAAGLKCYNSSGGFAIDIVGAIKLNASTIVSNGSATATFPGNNKPGTSSTNGWMQVTIGDNKWLIPAWLLN